MLFINRINFKFSAHIFFFFMNLGEKSLVTTDLSDSDKTVYTRAFVGAETVMNLTFVLR